MSRVAKKPDFVTISIYAVLAVFVIYFAASLGACFDVACHAKRKKLSGKTQKIPFKMTFGYILKGIFLSM